MILKQERFKQCQKAFSGALTHVRGNAFQNAPAMQSVANFFIVADNYKQWAMIKL